MTILQSLVNLLIALLAFFIVQWVGSLVVPEGKDKDKIINVLALLIAFLVFILNLAARIHGLS